MKLYTFNFRDVIKSQIQKDMKKVIITIMLFLLSNFSSIAAKNENNPSTPERIEMEIIKLNDGEPERSFNLPIIDAVFYSSTKEIEVTLFNIGEARVHIVNSQNQIIKSTNVYTDTPVTINQCVTEWVGTYNIIIISENWYAEGMFRL